jgi:hypothetical protein
MKNLMMLMLAMTSFVYAGQCDDYSYAKSHSTHKYRGNFAKYNCDQNGRKSPTSFFVEWTGKIRREQLDRKIMHFQVTEFDSVSGNTCWREVILDCRNEKGFLGSVNPLSYSSGNPQREENGVIYENVIAHHPGDPRYADQEAAQEAAHEIGRNFYHNQRMEQSGSAVSFYDESFPFNAIMFCHDHK